MKHLRETFTDEEFEKLKNTKGNITWHEFIMLLTQPSGLHKRLAKEIKEEIMNGWESHEKSHFKGFLEAEIKPYWPQLYTFLVENLSEEAEK